VFTDGCGMYAHSTCPAESDSFALLFVAMTFGLPWTVPRLYDDPSLGSYAAYPFSHGPGVLRVAPGSDADVDAQDARRVALAVDAESGYLIQGVIPASMAMRLLLPFRLELDGRVSLLTDVLEQPVQLAAAATAHLSYRFAQGKRFDFRTGLGARLFALNEVRPGFDMMYAVDSFIANSVVFRLELHLGSAGQAFVGQARSTLGVMFGRTELYAGYDHTSYIGEAGRARLGGPVLGVRAWF
jgi:hypothetical protein